MSFWARLSRRRSTEHVHANSRLSQERSAPPGGRLDTTSSSEPIQEQNCPRCGLNDLRPLANTHVKCESCGLWMRVERHPALDSVSAAPQRVAFAGFVARAVGIIERDVTGAEVASRAATKDEQRGQKQPKGFLSSLGRLLGGSK